MISTADLNPFQLVLVANALWGVGYTFTSGAAQAWIADEVGDRRAGNAFMRGSLIGKIAGLAGIHIQLPIVPGGLCFLALGIVLSLIMPEDGFAPTPPEDRQSWRTMGGTFRAGIRLIRAPTFRAAALFGLHCRLGSLGVSGEYLVLVYRPDSLHNRPVYDHRNTALPTTDGPARLHPAPRQMI